MKQEQQMAILMADLSGYTAMTEIHGAQQAAALVGRYIEMAGQAMYGSSKLLERVGDQLVIVSPDANDLVKTALQLLELSVAESKFLGVHAGLHYGDVLEYKGSFYGSAMNLAARLATAAIAGKAICSMDFINAVSQQGDFDFHSYRSVRFKNIMRPVIVAELRGNSTYHNPHHHKDPVCQMHLTEPGLYWDHDHARYHFCSEDCLQFFIHNPMDVLQGAV